jgi:hypothetical protein
MVVSVILLVAAILIPAHAQGYSTGRHWQGSNYTLAIRVDQTVASQLGLSGRQTEINQNIGSAVAKWNNASWWTYYNDTSQTCTEGASG